MAKKTFSVLIYFVGLILFTSILHGQSSKRTVTLPSGEVVWNLNGEWDALYEHHRLGKSTDLVKIIQRDGSFEGVKTMGGVYVPKNAVSIRGELRKGGISQVQLVMRIMYSGDPGKMTEKEQLLDCKGQISEDGSSIIIDGGETIRVTLTRK